MSAIIAHTTDLSGDDGAALVHAAALAAAGAGDLITIHGNAPPGRAAALPDAGPLAAGWGRPLRHQRRCHECCDDVTDTVLDALAAIAPAAVVTGTHARHGVSAWVRSSIGWALARNLAVPTLIVPNHGRGFVDGATGALQVGRVLIALDASRAAAAAAAAVRAALDALLGPGPRVLRELVGGDLDAALHREVATWAPDLIALPHPLAGGHAALIASRAERAMHDLATPILVVPVPA